MMETHKCALRLSMRTFKWQVRDASLESWMSEQEVRK